PVPNVLGAGPVRVSTTLPFTIKVPLPFFVNVAPSASAIFPTVRVLFAPTVTVPSGVTPPRLITLPVLEVGATLSLIWNTAGLPAAPVRVIAREFGVGPTR